MTASAEAATWGTAIATLVLAVATFLIVVFNVKVLRATKHQASATAAQAGETAKQAEIAARSLASQLAPHLVPRGPDHCRVGDPEEIDSGPQKLSVRPVLVELINAGNGIALIDAARVTSVDLSSRGLGAQVPPAVPAGAIATVRLYAAAPLPQAPPAGEKTELALDYHGVDDIARQSRFSVQYLGPGRWRVELLTPESM
jgi:hypothetical protein